MYILIAAILILGGLVWVFSKSPRLGGIITSEKKLKLEQSENYKEDKFQNLVYTPMVAPKLSTMMKFFSKNEVQIPDKQLKTKAFNKSEFENTAQNALSFTWFGHSSVLLKLENTTFLIDPVFGKRASIFSFIGPKRFDYSNHYLAENLPQIDVVLITHDHYDHLEFETIVALKDKVKLFYVPLGVAFHLEQWGVEPGKIIEADWWTEHLFSEDIKLVFTPTRHFSGRSLTSRNQTLWGAWAILGNSNKVFFSGDSGYFEEFKKVGEKFGPFDLVFVENGQYNEDWASIHMMPEQSVLAASELKAKTVVPIHWGKFSLSIHAWDEPVKRFLSAAEKFTYQVYTPAPGEIMTFPWGKTTDWWTD
ncbi:MAG: MBL fold metallo-hydrolase [Bacteroidota bacterium]